MVRRRGVTGVDGEQLPLDVRREVVDPGGVRDRRRVAAERRPLDRPLEVGLDGDVQPGVRRPAPARSGRPRCWRTPPAGERSPTRRPTSACGRARPAHRWR